MATAFLDHWTVYCGHPEMRAVYDCFLRSRLVLLCAVVHPPSKLVFPPHWQVFLTLSERRDTFFFLLALAPESYHSFPKFCLPYPHRCPGVFPLHRQPHLMRMRPTPIWVLKPTWMGCRWECIDAERERVCQPSAHRRKQIEMLWMSNFMTQSVSEVALVIAFE